MTRGPLAATLGRLDAADEECTYRAGEPDGDDWYRLDRALADPAILDRWYRDILDGEARGRRDVAGSYFASWLVGTVVGTAAVALAVEHRTWPLRAGNLAVHRDHAGWFDGIAVIGPQVRMLRSSGSAACGARWPTGWPRRWCTEPPNTVAMPMSRGPTHQPCSTCSPSAPRCP